MEQICLPGLQFIIFSFRISKVGLKKINYSAFWSLQPFSQDCVASFSHHLLCVCVNLMR